MEEKRPRFMSFAEATAWAMEQVETPKTDAFCKIAEDMGVKVIDHPAVEPEPGDFTGLAMTKEVSYQRWLIEVGELQEQLETQLDNAQDLWMAGEDYKSWLVKHDDRWFDVERSMKQVYEHIDSALHFLRIIRGVK